MRPLGRGGLSVGRLSFGAAPIGNLGRRVEEDEWRGALTAAWEAGVRYFDTAPHYGLGLAEQRLAEGLQGRARDEFIVSTKVGRRLAPTSSDAMDDEGFAVPATHVRVRDYSRDGVLASLGRRSRGRFRPWRSCARRASSRPTARA
jgi:D-threo-aldose 1-dehydrogenase